jgi:uncharacterized short protein YbdD (DUF466 family)
VPEHHHFVRKSKKNHPDKKQMPPQTEFPAAALF